MWDQTVESIRRHHTTQSAPTSVAFVTWESPESAVLCAQANICARPFACIGIMAPEPRDLYWANLSGIGAGNWAKVFKSLFVHGLCLLITHAGTLLFMVFYNTIAVSAISSLFDLDSIAKIFPVFREVIDGLSPVTKQFIQGVVPTAVLGMISMHARLISI